MTKIVTLIIVPLVIGVAANLATPTVRHLFLKVSLFLLEKLRLLGRRGVQQRIKQLESDLKEIPALVEGARLTIDISRQLMANLFGLWILLFFTIVITIAAIHNPGILEQPIMGAFYGFAGFSSRIFFSLVALWSKLDQVADLAKFKQRTDSDIARLKLLLAKMETKD